MATIEFGEFTLKMLEDARAAVVRTTDAADDSGICRSRALVVIVLDGLGRVRETLLEGAALFPLAELHFPQLGASGQETIMAALRAAIGAAISTPEVPVEAVRQSIASLAALCERGGRASGFTEELTLRLESTLAPEARLCARAQGIRGAVKAASFQLACDTCLEHRLAWHRRGALTRDELSRFVETPGCAPHRGLQAIAEHHLEKGDGEAAESSWLRASAAWPGAILPLSLVTTGLRAARASASRAKVKQRLDALDASLNDHELPYDEFEAVLELTRLRTSMLLPRQLPPRVRASVEGASRLAARLDARTSTSHAAHRLAAITQERT